MAQLLAGDAGPSLSRGATGGVTGGVTGQLALVGIGVPPEGVNAPAPWPAAAAGLAAARPRLVIVAPAAATVKNAFLTRVRIGWILRCLAARPGNATPGGAASGHTPIRSLHVTQS